jgi:hypothetical protein
MILVPRNRVKKETPGDDLRYGRLRTMQPTLENRKTGQGHHEEQMRCSIEREPKNELEERELSGIMKLLKKRLFKGLQVVNDFG